MSKKHFRKIIMLACVVLCSITLFVNADRETASANNNVQISQQALWPALNNSSLYANDKTFTVSFTLSRQYNYLSLTHKTDGFAIISNPVFNSTSYIISVQLAYYLNYDEYDQAIYYAEPQFNLFVQVSGGITFNANVYGFSTEYGLYISPYYEGARHEYDEMWASKTNGVGETTIISVTPPSGGISPVPGANINGSISINIGGTVSRLRNVRVELRKKFIIGSSPIESTYTNSNGEFSFSFLSNNDDIFLRVYTVGRNSGRQSGSAVTVRKWAGIINYHHDFGHRNKMQNESIHISEVLSTWSNMSAAQRQLVNAFDICQAVVWGCRIYTADA